MNVLTDEQMGRIWALGGPTLSSAEIIQLAEEKGQQMMDNEEELKEVVEGAVKRLTEMKTMKKARQKARRTSPKEEEPKMRSSEVSKQVPWEQECAQGKAYFLSKDYPR